MPRVKTDNSEQEEGKSPEEQNQEDVQTMLTEMGEGPEPEEQPDEAEEPEGSEQQESTETPEEREEPEAEGQEEQEEQGEQEEPSKDEVIKQLREEVNRLSQGEPEAGQREQPEREEPEGEQREEPEEQTLEFEGQEFVTEEEFDEIIQDRNKLNEVLNKVAFQSAKAAREAVLRQVPEVVSKTTNRQMSVRQAVQNFYQENPDLQEYGSYVGHIANRIKAENPDLGMNDILSKAGQEARSKLNIQKKAKEQEEERRNEDNPQEGPAFAKRGTGRREGGGKDARTDFQKQADEMINSL